MLGLGSYLVVMVFISVMTIFQSCDSKEPEVTGNPLDRHLLAKVAAQDYWEKYIKVLKFPGDDKDFISKELLTVDVIATAIMEEHLFGIPAKVTLSQYILESKSNGKYSFTELATTNNNYFGVKAKDNEEYKIHATREVLNSRDTIVDAKFAVYKSKWWSIRAHTKKLFKYYQPKEKSLEGWLNRLQGKYATDPNYAFTLKRVINTYNLNHL